MLGATYRIAGGLRLNPIRANDRLAIHEVHSGRLHVFVLTVCEWNLGPFWRGTSMLEAGREGLKIA
jgi:hypothetical protein